MSKSSRRPKAKRWWSRAAWLLVGSVVSVFAFFGIANARVLASAKGRVCSEVSKIPHHRVAIVLGTSPRYHGAPNLYFTGRIEAAAKLYFAGKVQRILVSGDNGQLTYDEPRAMKKALVEHGVPPEVITKDCAGFRTLDSMVRAKKVFGLNDATIVTDDFHMARSLYYARSAGLDADGFTSRTLSPRITQSVRFRETLARACAVLDVDVLHVGPKFLGKPEPIR